MSRSGRGSPSAPGAEARRIAIEAVRRIDEEGAYANLVVPRLLDDAALEQRDANLVTELVYGSTRMRRACDWLVDRFVVSPPAPALRASLRVGAYQLAFTRVPAHAAVSATVAASAKRNRAPVNAILRRVSESLPVDWPSDGVRLSYPDWIIERMTADLGRDEALAMLETMNRAPSVTEREDGYVQDRASQWVVETVEAAPGQLILDLCAAPGGKATAIAATGATVVAADIHPGRAALVAKNATRLGCGVDVVVADGRRPPFGPGFDAVLVDAPCSGLGVLRRRPDARWRIQQSDIGELATLQRQLLVAAASVVQPGGRLVYSVCTVTREETIEVATSFGAGHPDRASLELDSGDRWRTLGPGLQVLPQDHDTDGMSVFAWRV